MKSWQIVFTHFPRSRGPATVVQRLAIGAGLHFEATSILVMGNGKDPLVLEVRFDGKKQCTTLFEREEPWYWLARFVEPDSLHQEAQITVASQPEIQWNVTLMGFIRPNPRTT